jgi:hypothetical protein
MKYRLVIAILGLFFFSACDEGLAPDPVDARTPGLGGTLIVTSAWPPADSVRDLRIVAFRNYPPADILTEVLGGTALFSEQLAFDESPQAWRIVLGGLKGRFEYVVAAQQFGGNLFQDWRVVGVYTATGDVNQPTAVDLGNGSYIGDLEIKVDFTNLPPQPF